VVTFPFISSMDGFESLLLIGGCLRGDVDGVDGSGNDNFRLLHRRLCNAFYRVRSVIWHYATELQRRRNSN